MSPVRRTYVTINWILIALFIVSLVTLIVAITRHDKKIAKTCTNCNHCLFDLGSSCTNN